MSIFRAILTLFVINLSTISINAKTLVVYYSYTNSVEQIVNNLRSQIACDVFRIELSEMPEGMYIVKNKNLSAQKIIIKQ